MKVLAFFSLILAVATSYPVVKTYTLSSLSDAIENSKLDPGMMPYLKDAMNEIMLAMFTGENEKFVRAVVTSPSGGSTWTLEEMKAALSDPATYEEYVVALKQAVNFVEHQNATGHIQETVEVVIPALDISTWTQSDLNEALRSPSTKAALIPYLKKAHTKLNAALVKGETWETVNMVTPVGLIPHKGDFQYLVKRMKTLSRSQRKGYKLVIGSSNV